MNRFVFLLGFLLMALMTVTLQAQAETLKPSIDLVGKI